MASGLDCVSPFCLRAYAEQLTLTFQRIFSHSLELCEVPSCFKSAMIVLVPKTNFTGLTLECLGNISQVMAAFTNQWMVIWQSFSREFFSLLRYLAIAHRSDGCVEIIILLILLLDKKFNSTISMHLSLAYSQPMSGWPEPDEIWQFFIIAPGKCKINTTVKQ